MQFAVNPKLAQNYVSHADDHNKLPSKYKTHLRLMEASEISWCECVQTVQRPTMYVPNFKCKSFVCYFNPNGTAGIFFEQYCQPTCTNDQTIAGIFFLC